MEIIEKRLVNSNVIDIANYEAIKQFEKDFETKQLTGNDASETVKDIIDNDIYDLTLYSCLKQCEKLDISVESRTKKNKEVYSTFLKDKMLHQLWNSSPKNYTIRDYIRVVQSMFDYNDKKTNDKLRIKLFNNLFPHGVHDNEKPANNVNVIYLQHISSFHDYIIEEFLNKADHKKIYSKIVYEYKDTLKYTTAELRKLIEKFLDGEDTSTDKKVSIVLRELRIARTFIEKQLVKGSDYLKRTKIIDDNVEDFDVYPTLRNAYSKFKQLYSEVKDFYDDHMDVPENYTEFLVYLMKAAFFLRDKLNYKESLKTLISELKNRTDFKINKNVSKKLGEMMKSEFNETNIRAAIDEKEMLPTRIYDYSDTEIYDKVGRYCTVPLSTKLRFGVGIAIIAYINREIEKLLLTNGKKKQLFIYIKVDEKINETVTEDK